MQIFTYKKRDFSNLNIHATRIDNQGLFFLSDIQSQTMQHWVLMGFDWTLGYRTYPEMIDLARKLKAILCIFENGKLLECFDFEEDLVLTYEQEIAVNDPLENAPVWNEGVGGVIEAPEDVVIDEEVILRFTPLPGFIFKGWYDENGDLISNEQDHKFTVKKSETITARSQKRWYNVSCEFDNDMGLVNGLGRYVYGTEVTLTAIGKMGYKFKVWSDGYAEAVRKVTVTENINLEVEFEVNDVEVNAKVYPVGAGSIMNVNNITQEGQMADFLATPTADYIFDEFTYATEEDPTGEETLLSKTNPVKIKLLAGRNITARFKLPVVDVNMVAKTGYNDADPQVATTFSEGTTGGTVSNQGGLLTPGTSFQSTATPAEGYEFVGWYNLLSGGTLLSANETYINSVGNSDTTIYARFQKKWYTVTATKGDYIESVEVGPSLPPTQEGNGTMRIAHGEGVILSCTLLPDTTDYTYDFDGWYDNNVKVPNEGTTAAIDPVTKNINWTAKGKRTVTPNYSLTAKAVFKAIGSDTYVESTEGGTVTPTSGSYKNGVKVTLTSEVAADTETAEYLFDGYFTGMNDGDNLSYSKTYGITISGNTTVYARFSASEKSGS